MRKISRPKYFNKMVNLLGSEQIKVLTGVKGSGKTELLKDLIEYLGINSETTNIIYISFDLVDYDNLKRKTALKRYINNSYIDGRMNFVILDEVQRAEGFVDSLEELHKDGRFQVYAAASCDILANQEVSDRLSTIIEQIKVYPFSYKEYLEFYNIDVTEEKLYTILDGYIRNGGLASSYNFSALTQRYNVVEKEIFNQSIMKEIMEVHNIKNRTILYGTVNYLYNNIGEVTSGGEISNYLVSKGATSDNKTVSKYINYLKASCLINEVLRFDLRKQTLLAKENKYYVVDLMFKYAHSSSQELERKKIFEDLVVTQLLRRGAKVLSAQLYQEDFGFLVEEEGKKYYVAVCPLSDAETLEKEGEKLLRIKDNYPKTILTRTYKPKQDYKGIDIVDLGEWLYNN